MFARPHQHRQLQFLPDTARKSYSCHSPGLGGYPPKERLFATQTGCGRELLHRSQRAYVRRLGKGAKARIRSCGHRHSSLLTDCLAMKT